MLILIIASPLFLTWTLLSYQYIYTKKWNCKHIIQISFKHHLINVEYPSLWGSGHFLFFINWGLENQPPIFVAFEANPVNFHVTQNFFKGNQTWRYFINCRTSNKPFRQIRRGVIIATRVKKRSTCISVVRHQKLIFFIYCNGE